MEKNMGRMHHATLVLPNQQGKPRAEQFAAPYAVSAVPDAGDVEFAATVAEFRRINHVHFPSLSQYRWVLMQLGYSKPMKRR